MATILGILHIFTNSWSGVPLYLKPLDGFAHHSLQRPDYSPWSPTHPFLNAHSINIAQYLPYPESGRRSHSLSNVKLQRISGLTLHAPQPPSMDSARWLTPCLDLGREFVLLAFVESVLEEQNQETD